MPGLVGAAPAEQRGCRRASGCKAHSVHSALPACRLVRMMHGSLPCCAPLPAGPATLASVAPASPCPPTSARACAPSPASLPAAPVSALAGSATPPWGAPTSPCSTPWRTWGSPCPSSSYLQVGWLAGCQYWCVSVVLLMCFVGPSSPARVTLSRLAGLGEVGGHQMQPLAASFLRTTLSSPSRPPCSDGLADSLGLRWRQRRRAVCGVQRGRARRGGGGRRQRLHRSGGALRDAAGWVLPAFRQVLGR